MNILAIGAHPDDVEFGCGGTLAKHMDDGHSVTVVVMTSGTVLDAHTGDILRTSVQSGEEAANSASVLGAEVIIGPFQDTKLPFDGESVGFLERIIKQKEIDFIYTHWPGDSHQDHINTLNATLAAGRLVPNIICYEQVPVPRVSIEIYKVNHYVDITQHWDLKLEACSKHSSQIKKFKERQGIDMLDLLKHQAKFRGGQSFCEYAEAFHILKLVS